MPEAVVEWKLNRGVRQRKVNNADFLIVDDLNISDFDVSNEAFIDKTIVRVKK